MKKKYFILLFTLVSMVGYSQEGKPNSEKHPLTITVQNDDSIYNIAGIEKKPEYPGGMAEFYKYIGKKYRTPNVKGLQGKIFVTFIIEKDGSITDVKVLRDIGYGTGEEAVRVLKKCDNWIPGEQNGQKVRVLYSLPIVIKTQ